MRLDLALRLTGMASAQATEEGVQIRSHRRWFLRRSEVPAARKDRPALDVAQALQIRERQLSLGNGLMREKTKRRRRGNSRLATTDTALDAFGKGSCRAMQILLG